MKKFNIAIVLTIIFLATGMSAANAAKIEKPTQESDDPAFALYKDKYRFQMLSGAMQSALERRFGRKRKIKIVPPTDQSLQGELAPTVAVTNVLANNPAADLTNQDTQSESTVVLAGSNIVVGWRSTFYRLFTLRKWWNKLHGSRAATQ
jgi:hypothetical protein